MESTVEPSREASEPAVGWGHPPPPFSKDEYKQRLDRVRQRMAKDRIDMLLVTMPEDMCYLHGLQMNWYQQNGPKDWGMVSMTAVHVDHDRLIHFDTHAEILAATSVAEDIRRPGRGDRPYEAQAKQLEAEGWLKGTVGLQYWSYRPNPARCRQVEAVFTGPGSKLVDGSDVVSDVRRLKSPAEIAVMEEAGRICDVGLTAVTDTLRPGVTELEVYGEMMRAMARAGGETAGLLQCVKAGGAKFLHGIASTRVIQKGDHVVADICGVKHRYHANTCRGWFVGDPPKELANLYKMNGGAYQVILDTAKAGTPLGSVTRALREYYKGTGAWQMRIDGKISGYTGGYELGISFPPDWVGWWMFNVGENDPGGEVLLERQVSNYESFSTGSTALINTFVYENTGSRMLTKVPSELIVV
jgi:Xaa-Pro aminopeptidase